MGAAPWLQCKGFSLRWLLLLQSMGSRVRAQWLQHTGLVFPQHVRSWASLVDQMVKNLPAMWETWVRSLGWEDPLDEGMATHSSILA